MFNYSPNATSLDKFQYAISKHDIYRESDPLIPILLNDIATLPIESVGKLKIANKS